ncbi:MAG TPA: glycerol-3-phosphate 1-O-acyltransferase PlsY [Stellaceae bacterium]|nr:glycerol-3-phosphate 1-O-acyltransferase PlsY [Stellaceae bacterium]
MPHPLGSFAYVWPFYAAAVIAYLLGSVPFGLVLTRLGGYGDIRAIGSGNIGATNVLRTGNKGLALLTLLLDLGKGAIAVLIARNFGPDIAVIAAAAVVLGHLFPIWLAFKGGKGVATAGGVLLAIAWPVGVLALATWLAAAVLTRYSSLAALLACAAAPLYAWLLGFDPQRLELIAVIAFLVILRHHANIRRLVRGEESKIRLRRS